MYVLQVVRETNVEASTSTPEGQGLASRKQSIKVGTKVEVVQWNIISIN
jgi:hypothetical protein